MGASDDYRLIERAIHYMEGHAHEQPSLEAVAAQAGMEYLAFQRLFRRWAGISPGRFRQYLTVAHARQMLSDSATVLETSLALGLSGPGRLHEQFINIEAMSPGEFAQQARGMRIAWGVADGPFGDMLLAATSRGLCHLSFIESAETASLASELQQAWPDARIERDQARIDEIAARLFDRSADDPGQAVLSVRGTNFQVQVWRALLGVPSGSVVSYRMLATMLGRPRAARSVASAVAANPVGWLIPCHRVIRTGGAAGGYHWGEMRKRLMIAREAVEAESGQEIEDALHHAGQ